MQTEELMSTQVDNSTLTNSPYGHCTWGSHCTTCSRLIYCSLWTIPWGVSAGQAAPCSSSPQLNLL